MTVSVLTADWLWCKSSSATIPDCKRTQISSLYWNWLASIFPSLLSLPQEIQPVWKSVEDLFSFLAQSHLEAVRESTGEGVWSSDHCREAGGVRSLSAGPQTDYSPFSPIWTGRGRFCTLFPNEARRKLRLLWDISDGIDHMWRLKPVRSGIYTPFTFCCAFWNGLWNYARFFFFFFWLLQHPFRSVCERIAPIWLSIISQRHCYHVSLGRARMFQRCTGSFS